METPGIFIPAACAAIGLGALDRAIWWRTRFGLSMDYEDVQSWIIPRTFPTQLPFRIAKLILGAGFIVSVVLTMRAGASRHLGLAAITFAVLGLFAIVTFWESVRAFRHFASHSLPPPNRGGYRGS